MSIEALENENISLGGGAGIQSAQFVASKNAGAVITGNCGPNAVKTLSAAGVQLFVDQSGTVKEAIDRLKNNELRPAQEPNVPDHFGIGGEDKQPQPGIGSGEIDQPSTGGMGMGGGKGMGRGMGMGGGKGMGRGMGMGGGKGMGRGMGMSGGNQSNHIVQENLSKDQELSFLKKQSGELARQMEDIQARIKRLEKSD